VKLAEAGIVSLKSQAEAYDMQLREVENHLSSRHAELEQLELKLVAIPVQMEKLSHKVRMVLHLTNVCLVFNWNHFLCYTSQQPNIHLLLLLSLLSSPLSLLLLLLVLLLLYFGKKKIRNALQMLFNSVVSHLFFSPLLCSCSVFILDGLCM